MKECSRSLEYINCNHPPPQYLGPWPGIAVLMDSSVGKHLTAEE